MAPDLQKWLFRYKLLHIAIWTALSLVMLAVYYDPAGSFWLQWLEAIVLTAVCIPLFYLAAYWLIPKFLYKKQFVRYISSVLGLVVANTALSFVVCRLIYHLVTGHPFLPSGQTGIQLVNVLMWDNIIAFAVASALKIMSDRFRMERQLLQAEKEKVTTELAFLRSQVNPHFLFNIMNTIYFQIHKENTTARESVEKLSQMLRYQLYECNTDRIEIGKELDYIRHYVTMQSLRMEKGLDIRLEIDEDLSGFRIAPLLILPLVENAFKHISHDKDLPHNRILIHLKQDGAGCFTIHVANTCAAQPAARHLLHAGGLGVQNLKRRLELLYPDRHTLQVQRSDTLYETTLKIRYE